MGTVWRTYMRSIQNFVGLRPATPNDFGRIAVQNKKSSFLILNYILYQLCLYIFQQSKHCKPPEHPAKGAKILKERANYYKLRIASLLIFITKLRVSPPMEIEAANGISRKSRGILYQLKKELNSRKLTLIEHIHIIFQFQKQQYNKKQFFALIQKYDNKLLLSELDQLFDDLDENRNQKVFYYYLKAVYESINQSDNPQLINRNNVIRTASKKNRETIVDIIPVYTEVRKVLLQSEDILEILHIFASQHGGYLTIGNITDIFNNLGYNNERYRKMFLESALEGNEKILLEDFLSKLDMNESARRSTIRENKSQAKIPHAEEMNKSQFIKNQLKESKIDESLALNLSLSKRTVSEADQCIELENIPPSLRPYFNYGSELETIFAHTAKEYIETKSMFIDPENPPYSLAYQWIHLAETSYNYELFQMAKSVLVRDRNRKGLGQLLEPKDIIQGNLGDCYFLSAVAGVVQKYPELVYRLFVLQKNPSHLYGVRLFIQGMWRTIILDACFPVNRNGGFCAAQPHHHEIWVMLLEKAWAKVYGSYDNIHAGYNEQGLNAVSGAPSVFVSAKENEFVRRVEVEINKGSIITCATSAYVNQLSKKDQDKFGIFENHAYSLLNIYSNLKSKDGSPLTLLKIRNPWGKKEWQGNWGFRSELWTNELKKKLGYEVNPKDGTFFMSQQDFSLYFDHVNICRVNLAYKNSWIEVTSDRQEFKAVKIRAKQKGDYYFTLYQQNPRRHSGKPYQKSKSWIFLLEEKNGKVQAIGSCCKDKRDNTLEVTLDVGEYIIISKIQWKLWEMHSYCLSSYGPEKVGFTPITFDIHMLSDFIESKAKLGFGKKSFYDNANILKRVQFSPDEGYGFILINNQENIIFDLTIRFQSHQGLTILPPYSLPIRLQIFPGEEVICKFLVDPTGYAYSLKESYNYLNAI